MAFDMTMSVPQIRAANVTSDRSTKHCSNYFRQVQPHGSGTADSLLGFIFC